MASPFVAAGSAVSSSSAVTSFSIPSSGAGVAGQTVALLTFTSNTATVSPPDASWTTAYNTVPSGNTKYRLTLFTKTLTAAEPASYTVTLGSSSNISGLALVYSAASGAIDVAACTSGYVGSNAKATSPRVTTTHDSETLLLVFADAQGGSYAAPSGATLRGATNTSPVTNGLTSMMVADATAATAGQTAAFSSAHNDFAGGASTLVATIALIGGVAPVTGVAGLSGSGSLTTSGQPRNTAVAALTGVGSLTVNAKPATTGPAALSGSGSLSATGTSTTSTTVVLTGSGALSTSGTTPVTGNTALAGSGTLITGSTAAAAGTAALAGNGQLISQGSGSVTPIGTAVLTGAGQLSTTPTVNASAGATLTGVGTLIADSTGSARLYQKQPDGTWKPVVLYQLDATGVWDPVIVAP